jgi:transcriptional regulator with XRE-family HTH domain
MADPQHMTRDSPITANELAERLLGIRKRAGLTQEIVAAHLGLARTAISQIERGRRAVTALELISLVHLYQSSFYEMVRRG